MAVIRDRGLNAIPFGWVVIGLSVLTTVVFSHITQGIGVLVPFIQDDLEVNRAELGLIASGMFGGGIAAALLAGWLVDVMGVRRLQAASLVVAAGAVVLFSQIRSPVHGLLLALLIGVAHSVTFPAYGKAIMDWVTPPRTRGLAMGIREASIPVGGIMAAVLVTFLALTFGWRTAVIVVAVAIGITGVVFFSVYRDKPSSGYTEGETRSRAGGRVSLLARDRDIWLISGFGAAFAGLQMVLVTYLVLFLKEHLDMSATVAGVCFAFLLAGAAVARIGWGLVSDFLMGGRRIVTLATVGLLAVVSMALMVWLPSDASLAVVLVVVFVVGVTCLGGTGVWVILVAEMAGPALTGTAMGFTGTIGRMGSFGVAPIFGLIVDQTGSYDVGWWSMLGLAGVGTLLLAFLRPQVRRR